MPYENHFPMFPLWNMTNKTVIYNANNWKSARLLRSSVNVYWVIEGIKPTKYPVPMWQQC